MFERFTQRSRKVLGMAQQEAVALGAAEIELAHVLVALADDVEGVAGQVLAGLGVTAAGLRNGPAGGDGRPRTVNEDAEALRAIGIDLHQVLRNADETFGRERVDQALTASGLRKPKFSDNGKRVLEESLRTAVRMRNNFIGTEHVLLAVLDVGGEEILPSLLGEGAPAADDVRSAVLRRIDELTRDG